MSATSLRALLIKLFTVPAGVDVRFHPTLILIGAYAAVFHVLFCVLFVLLHVMPMAFFNVISVGLWIWALFLAKKGRSTAIR